MISLQGDQTPFDLPVLCSNLREIKQNECVIAMYIQPLKATFGLSDYVPSIAREVIERPKVAFKGWIYIVLCTQLVQEILMVKNPESA